MPEELLSSDELQEALLDDFPPVPTEAWQRKIMEDLKGADYERRLVWKPLEGFAVEPFYRAEDLETETPGLLRLQADGRNDWHIRQNIRLHDPAEANRRAHEALERGATALGFIADGHRDGLRQDDLERVLKGIPLESTPLHWMSRGAARPLLAMLFNEADRRGVPRSTLQGSASTDPITRLAHHGRLHTGHAFDEAARLLGEVTASGTALQTLRIDATPFHSAGASSVQELAFALAAASEYLAQLTERGITVADVVQQMRFVIPVGTSYFMEIARVRALRLLIRQLIQAYGMGNAPDTPPGIEAVTSRWSLTRYDPHSNLLRATTEAAAAIIGGCDTLTIRPFDTAAGLPGDTALRLARNIQLILKHEAHLDAVADPAAGSYYIETLTDRLARHAWSLFQQVEARGGLLQAFEDGFIQQAIRTIREQRDQDIATGKRVFVGTNAFPDFDEALLTEDASPETPSPTVPTVFLFDLETSLDALQAALREGATLADLPKASSSHDVVEAEPLPDGRGAEAFEALRLRTERHAQRTGRPATVLLLPIGKPALANARATFSRNFFGCGGFSLIENPPMGSIEEGAEAALNSGADIVVLCSSDPEYAAFAPTLSRLLDAAETRPLLVVAGYPKDLVDDLKAAGVDAFIHLKQNLLETLARFQNRLGIEE